MNFFKTKTSWSNAEFVIIKLSIASAYLMAGAYFHNFFSTYYSYLFILFGISATWAVYFWLHKMRSKA